MSTRPHCSCSTLSSRCGWRCGWWASASRGSGAGARRTVGSSSSVSGTPAGPTRTGPSTGPSTGSARTRCIGGACCDRGRKCGGRLPDDAEPAYTEDSELRRSSSTACVEEPVPLSEEELRLLEQMERALVEEDPKFASTLRGTTLRQAARRRALFAAFVFAVGIAVLMGGAISGYWQIGIVGFVIMLDRKSTRLNSSHSQ